MQRKVLSQDLKIGMFVAKLDRPWIDTPFQAQGFMLKDEDQLRQVQRTCRWVMIDSADDTELSTRAAQPQDEPDSLAALDHLLQNKAALPAVNNPGASAAKPSPSVWGNIREGIKEFVSGNSNEDKASAVGVMQRPAFIPEIYTLTRYDNQYSVEQEIARATSVFGHTNALLNEMRDELLAGNKLEFHKIESAIGNLCDSVVSNPDALMWVARMREQEVSTHGHGLNVAIFLISFGRHLGLATSSLAHLGMIGLMLDIGKIRLPAALLEKNARLTSDEFEQIKDHVEYSVNILNESSAIHADIIEGIAQHHERINGTGYPFNLMGNEISLYGRMAAIADTFAAIIKKRPYAAPVSPHEALQMLSDWGGSQFDANMVEQFIQSVGVFPVGCMVELSTNEVAMVVTHNKFKRLRPRVMIIAGANKSPCTSPVHLDLLADVSENPVYIRRGLPSGAYGLDPADYPLA